MLIRRLIDGKEISIELTDEEVYNAYVERQHLYDAMNVESYFDSYKDDDDLYLEFGKTKEELKEFYDEIAYEMRRYIDKYDMDWEYAMSDAIYAILGREEV